MLHEVYMKIKLLLTVLIFTFMITPVFAETVVDETTSPEYLYTHGHSEAVIDIVQMTKAGINGEEYITANEAKHANDPKFVKWIRNIFIYLDPALDDGKFMHHDIKTSPGYEDL